jgi:hypothetical protein
MSEHVVNFTGIWRQDYADVEAWCSCGWSRMYVEGTTFVCLASDVFEHTNPRAAFMLPNPNPQPSMRPRP